MWRRGGDGDGWGRKGLKFLFRVNESKGSDTQVIAAFPIVGRLTQLDSTPTSSSTSGTSLSQLPISAGCENKGSSRKNMKQKIQCCLRSSSKHSKLKQDLNSRSIQYYFAKEVNIL